ncbi:MAG: ribosome-associated translation inhibitor RaiA [Candidatus Omnitrophica bacterium]|nr:ribosome-associated translation inhibitor RaiA [Candidatus Omnitrophota bacterium]
MNVTITGRNFDLDEPIKDYLNKKLERIERLYRRIYKCEVILTEEKQRQNAEVILYLKRNRVVGKESSPDMYASIDLAAEKVQKQLRKLHGRLSSKRRREVISRIVNPITRFRQPPLQGRGNIIKVNAFIDKPLLPEEAKLELELLDRDFIVFKNADTGETNVVYKRNDGNYGVIEPSF